MWSWSRAQVRTALTCASSSSVAASAGNAAGAVGIRRSYVYDKAGQLVVIGDSRRGNLSYRYDPVGRLLEAHSRLWPRDLCVRTGGEYRQSIRRWT